MNRFLMMTALCLGAFVSRYIPARKKDGSAGRESVTGKVPLDRFGAILFIISIASMIYAISAAQLAGFVIAITGFTAFLLWELRQSSPVLPIRLFTVWIINSRINNVNNKISTISEY